MREHEPRVIVALRELYLANADGELFKRLSSSDATVLPIVTGIRRADAAQQSGEVGIKPVGEAWEKLEKRAPAATRVITQIKPAKSADSNTIQIGIPSSVGDNEVKVSRRYSAKGIDDCLKCHRHVGVHAQFLDRPGRDWYSYVGGSGKTANGFGIFSLNGMSRQLITSGHLRRQQ